MDCRRIDNLISPYLDGELSPTENQAVRSHLAVCAICNQEYESMLRIASACHDLGKAMIKAPEGFSTSLMEKIAAEPAEVVLRPHWNRTHPTWKQAAVGVAAAALLTLGAISMNTASLMQIANNGPADNQPVIETPATTAPATEPGSAAGSEVPATTPGSKTNPTIALDPGPRSVNTAVFLNKERFVVTTLLRIKVTDTASALDHALQLAAAAQGQYLNLGQQVGENGPYTAVRITIARTKAADLSRQLSSLGMISGQEVDKNDITTKYADTLSQYQALVTQRAAAQDAGQKEVLDQRIADLAAQLQDWEQQAEQETIVLWLE